MSKRKKAPLDDKDTHLDDFLEGQRYQFVPGHYLGGKQTPFIKGRGNPLLGAVFWYIQAAILLLIIITLVSSSNANSFVYSNLLSLVIPLLYAFLSVCMGIRFTKKTISKYKNKKRK